MRVVAELRRPWRAHALLATALSLLVSGVVVPAAHAAFPGYDGRIAIIRSAHSPTGGSTADLWTMNPNGTGQQQLTSGAYVRGAQYSRDGRRLAYFADGPSGTDLFVLDADGANRRPVPTDRYVESIDWLDDDTLLASTRRDGSAVFTVEVSDGRTTVLVDQTASPGSNQYAVASPDGTMIAWSNTRQSSDGTRTISDASLMVAADDGSDVREIIDLPDDGNSYGVRPDWHPDGTTLDWKSLETEGYVWYRVDVTSSDVEFRRTDNSSLDKVLSPSGRYIARADSSYFMQILDRDGTVVHHVPKAAGVTRDAPVSWQPTATGSLPLDFDRPIVTVTSPTAGATVTQGSSVAADYSCRDDVAVSSCVGTVPAGSAVDTSTPGTQTFTVTATDTSGNVTTESVTYTVVAPPPADTTGPTVGFTPPSGTTVAQDSSLVVTYACSDEQGGSGVTSCEGSVPSGTSLSTATPGARTVTVTATDGAGNVTATTATYTVVTAFTFAGQVRGGGYVNVRRAGAVVPVKFSLGGNRGTSIVAAGYPSSARVSCSTGRVLSPSDEASTAPAPRFGLTYRPRTGLYVYEWQTRSTWKNTCRVFTIRLADGSEHQAIFRFR